MEISEELWCLKDIIKSKFDEYSKIEELIFTTFDFETEFFENQLLPYLFDVDNYKGKTNNRGKYIAHELDPKLKEIDLKVFYNHFEGDIVANINYKAIINPFKKILHAKLVIIRGQKNNKESITVLVTSANLTTSSYGANMENIGVIESTDQNIINSIEEKEDSLKGILEELNKINEISITGINEEDNKVIKELDKCNDLTVISPFIDQAIIDEFKNKKLNIIFTNLRGLKNKERFKNYSNIISVYPKSERNIHSKLYILNDLKTVIIGSHNFTKSALKDGNIEASLIVKKEEIFNSCKNIEKKIKNKCKSFDILESEIEVIPEEEKEKSNYYYISKAEIDWKEEKMLFEIKSKNGEININTIKLVFDNNEKFNIEIKSKTDREKCSVECNISEKLKDLLYESKYFDLIINQNIHMSGILYEKNGILDKLNTLKGQCFNDVLNYRFQNEAVDEAESLEEREHDSQLKNKDENIKSDNYSITDMFLSIKNRRMDLASGKNEEEKYIIKSNSVKRLAYLFNNYYESDKTKDLNFRNSKRKVLYYFLTCNEIRLLWKEFDFEKEDKDKKEIKEKLKKDFEELKDNAIAFITNEIESINKNEAKEILNIYLNNFGEKNEGL